MSYLLSAIYPSDHSLAAADYACSMADAIKCDVLLVHAYIIPVTFGELPLPVMPADDVRVQAEAQMQDALHILKERYPALDIRGNVVYGDLADVLEETAQTEQPLLTIVANDEDPGEEVWPGNVAGVLLREAGSPTLAIPYTCTFLRPEHICIASDGTTEPSPDAMRLLAKLQSLFNLRVTVLHVAAGDTNLLPEKQPLAIFSDYLPAQHTAYEEVHAAGNVDEAILEYTVQKGLNWLVVMPHQHGFWQALFHRSHTQHMLHLSRIPVLSVH